MATKASCTLWTAAQPLLLALGFLTALVRLIPVCISGHFLAVHGLWAVKFCHLSDSSWAVSLPGLSCSIQLPAIDLCLGPGSQALSVCLHFSRWKVRENNSVQTYEGPSLLRSMHFRSSLHGYHKFLFYSPRSWLAWPLYKTTAGTKIQNIYMPWCPMKRLFFLDLINRPAVQ